MDPADHDQSKTDSERRPIDEAETRGSGEETRARPAEPSPLELGQIFADRYEIQRELGRGGFGVVYRAFDRSALQRTVALKVIRFPAAEAGIRAAVARQKFLEEARLAGSLSHNNIATVFDVGESNGHAYMTQELVPGLDLRKLMARTGPLPLRRVVAIVRQICDGLAHAHERGIIHRDIKPGNVLVHGEDQAKITDFGLAQPRQHEDSTAVHDVAGTPGYMAPEQLRGQRVDGRADIFAVGCVLYQMLTGRAPFEGDSLASVVEKTLNASPPGPSRVRADLPRAVDRIVARALRKDPQERYEKISQLAQDLLHYEQFEYLLDGERGAKEIAPALRERKCLLFVGSHLRAAQGPGETRTIEQAISDSLAEHVPGRQMGERLPRVAQEIEIERGRSEMLRLLAAAVRSYAASPREVIRRAARLPVPVILTTAYDTFLEEELARAGRKVRRVLALAKLGELLPGEDLLVRLFGSMDSDESIIITEDDLWDFFGTFHSAPDSLRSLLATRTLLFVGYDPEDEGFRRLLSEIARFRIGSIGGCYLPGTDPSLPAVRWAERKGLRLIDAEPGSFLTQLEETLVEERRHESSRQTPAEQRRLPSRPFKFLNYYDAEDEAIFFGREGETRKLLSKIHSYPLNLLYASSGSGKTSLIRASLMPELIREGYCPVYARVYDDPETEIRQAALEATQGAGGLVPADRPLREFLPELAAAAGHPLVIFLDQFEEIFIRYNQAARDRFAKTLEGCLAGARGQVRFVLSMREDFLPRLSEFREHLPTIFHNEFRLERLSEAASRAAIAEPPRLLGLEVDPDLVERLIQDLSIEGIDPPQLQIVCDTLYDTLEPPSKRLTLAAYKALGETRGILTGYLERVLKELPQPERLAAREILKSLVTSEQTKTVTRLGDLVRAVGRAEEEVSRILSELANRRLIRRVPREEGFWYELTHEYLAEEITRWLSEKERELKKVRELLEQALRNHRNLGILMPANQITVILAHEDDLNLSKEERQFLRDSRLALSTRRRMAAAVVAVATVVLLSAGVLWRYAYLSGHIFIQSEDRELQETRWTNKVPHRFEGIFVYAGSPARWWLDSILGFPRFLRKTDFDVNQLDPAHRDAVKAGLILPAGVSIEEEIAGKLRADHKVRLLVTLGRRDEVLPIVDDIHSQRTLGSEEIDKLDHFLGFAGVLDGEMARILIEEALRGQVQEVFFAGAGGALRQAPGAAVSLLGGLTHETAHRYLASSMAVRETREASLLAMAAIGESDDALLIRPYLVDSDPVVRIAAFGALCQVGGCSVLPEIRELLLRPEFKSKLPNALLDFLGACGDVSDLPLLERIAPQLEGSWDSHQLVSALYRLGGRASIPAVLRVHHDHLMQSDRIGRTWKALSEIEEPAVVTYLRSGLESSDTLIRAHAAGALARRGDPSGLRSAAAIAFDVSEPLETRSAALEALSWFRGPSIRRSLINLLGTAPRDWLELKTTALQGLRWYDDEDTVSERLKAFSDPDQYVREAALESLVVPGYEKTATLLRASLGSLNPPAKLYAYRALSFLDGEDHLEEFKVFLETQADVTIDYNALAEAVSGLRDAYLQRSPDVAVAALRHPHHEVRLAAKLALLEHTDRSRVAELIRDLARSPDPVARQTGLWVQWALDLISRADMMEGKARELLLAGDAWRGSRILNRLRGNFWDSSGFADTLRAGLATTLTLNSLRKQIDRGSGRRLDADLDLAFSRVGGALRNLETAAMQYPGMMKSIREDPAFAALHSFYRFRVMMGLEPPKLVEEIPELAAADGSTNSAPEPSPRSASPP